MRFVVCAPSESESRRTLLNYHPTDLWQPFELAEPLDERWKEEKVNFPGLKSLNLTERKKDSIIYLSSEGEHLLNDIASGAVLIIGGTPFPTPNLNVM